MSTSAQTHDSCVASTMRTSGMTQESCVASTMCTLTVLHWAAQKEACPQTIYSYICSRLSKHKLRAMFCCAACHYIFAYCPKKGGRYWIENAWEALQESTYESGISIAQQQQHSGMSAAQPWHERKKIPHKVFTFSSYTDFNSIELTGTVLFAFSSVLEDNQSGTSQRCAAKEFFQINEIALEWSLANDPKASSERDFETSKEACHSSPGFQKLVHRKSKCPRCGPLLVT